MIYYLSAVKKKKIFRKKVFLNKEIEEQVVTKKSYQQKNA